MPMTGGSGARVQVWQHQTDATLTQAAPVQDTWYTALATTKNVRIIAMKFQIQTTGEDLEIELVIDGVTYIGSQTAVAGTSYLAYKNAGYSDLTTGTAGAHGAQYTFIEGRSVRIRLRKTTANGAGDLLGRITYAIIP